MLLTAFFILISSILLINLLRKPRIFPGPSPNFLFGNALQIDVNQIHQVIVEMKKYGPFSELWLLNRRVIMVNDAKTIEKIMQERPENFDRAKLVAWMFRPLRMSGVFDANGELWKVRRKMLSPAFTKVYVGKMYELMHCHAQSKIAMWKKCTNKEGVIQFNDIIQETLSFTLDIIFLLSFGQSASSLSAENLRRDLLSSFSTMQRWLGSVFPYYYFFYTNEDKMYFKMREQLGKIAGEQISLLKKSNNRPYSLLAGLVDHVVDENELVDIICHLIAAAYHTTGISLGITIYLLAKHQSYQEKIRESISHLKTISFEELWDNKEIKNFVNESLRRYTIVPYLALDTKDPVTMGGRTVPGGTLLMFNTLQYAISAFPDGEKFLPERWDNEFTHEQKFFGNISFGAFKRVCLGMNLGQTEMLLLIALLCKNFRISVPPGNDNIDLDTRVSRFVVEPKEKLPLSFTVL